MEYHLTAIALAIFIDFLIGDPPTWPHPVKMIGSGISLLEKKLNHGKSRRAKGTLMVILIACVTFLITAILVCYFYRLHPIAGIILESILISTTIAQKGLKDAALLVYRALMNGDLMEARLKLSYIVGRDTDNLGEEEIVRGTVETVAENTSDGVTAPLFWGLIGGAPLAFVYRAINTCDSMVGYKNEKYQDFGWASARLDDLVNWIPSRLTAFLMLLGNRPENMSVKNAWKILFRDAKSHPSPNSGWLEAAVAALLGIQLGGVNYYKGVKSNRAKMGDPIVSLSKEHISKTNKILIRTSLLFLLILWLGGILFEFATAWF
ncbi:adenosylcobinamide-phosphate synthase CbiB [Oceanobacillus bengalensis]|uniref:Cobalamin biosynthesis protein CobD n=1 Tax=Oceanobacillus bengalensis TaxID=1435466 RepID=A0A494YTF9_9BACI|nr:adenosylcobinamide-phosphate synthase CbiB [Oceanobacillus bengalensis]RKQ13423.1 cobalamin biosynthesis protein CobD [Oceanobacillus bengalensis]